MVGVGIVWFVAFLVRFCHIDSKKNGQLRKHATRSARSVRMIGQFSCPRRAYGSLTASTCSAWIRTTRSGVSMRRISYLLPLLLLATAMMAQSPTTGVPDGPLYFPSNDGHWEQVTPASVGWDEARLEAALDVARARNSSGVVVLHTHAGRPGESPFGARLVQGLG